MFLNINPLISKKQEKILFYVSNFLKPMSYAEIGAKCGCTKRHVIRVVKWLVQHNLIIKKFTTYTPEHTTLLLSGKNKYRPGQKCHPKKVVLDRTSMNRSLLKPEALATPISNEKSSFVDRKALVGSYGFEKETGYLPNWWFRDVTLLRKTLRLLKAKVAKGYGVKSFVKWVSHTLARGATGYRRHLAKAVTLNLAALGRTTPRKLMSLGEKERQLRMRDGGERVMTTAEMCQRVNAAKAGVAVAEKKEDECFYELSIKKLKTRVNERKNQQKPKKTMWQRRLEIVRVSPEVEEIYNNLHALKKRGLDTSFGNMQKLMRRNLGHLGLAARVVLKRITFLGARAVRDLNAYMHFVVGLERPIDILRKKVN